MTWVFGGITPFGYGVGISDIRVSWNTGYFKDCLQKVYPVLDFILSLNKLFVDRELRMNELKEEIKELKSKMQEE